MPGLKGQEKQRRDKRIIDLFKQSYPVNSIIEALILEGYDRLTAQYVRRILMNNGVKRTMSDEQTVRSLIRYQLLNAGRNVGCRIMQCRLRVQHGVLFGRNKIMDLLRTLDPEGVRDRYRGILKRRMYLSKGPLFLCHLDGYDKLKRYGLAIHGCIDGYSRHVLWLKASRSNNNPRIVAGFFIEWAYQELLVPRVIRTDRGTENGDLLLMQEALRDPIDQGEKCWLVGPSTSNSRIESFWAQIARRLLRDYKCAIQRIETDGNFDGSATHVTLMQFCVMPQLQKDLNREIVVQDQMNIRRSNQPHHISGRPGVLYRHPEITGTRSYGCPVTVEDLDSLQPYIETERALPEFTRYENICYQENLPLPDEISDITEAVGLYLNILDALQ